MRKYTCEWNELFHIKSGELNIYKINEDGTFKKKSELKIEKHIYKDTAVELGRFPHYMIKEIRDQVTAIQDSISGYDNNDNQNKEEFLQKIRSSKKIELIACGTSYHSCAAVEILLQNLLPDTFIKFYRSSDFNDREIEYPEGIKSTAIFVSQSGETEDTYRSLNFCKKQKVFCVSLTNMQDSKIARVSDWNLPVHAGVEMSVTSTKAYTSQYVTLLKLSLDISKTNDSEKIIELRKEIDRH